jgi:hypothetical protein
VTPGGLSSPDYTITFLPGTLSIVQDGVTVALTSSENPSQFGHEVTYTATVAAQSPGSGWLTVKSGQSVLITGTLSGTLTVSAGGALEIQGGKVTGESGIGGAVALSGNAGSAAIEGTTIGGSFSLNDTTGAEPIAADPTVAVESDTIGGVLSCTANNPAPTDSGHSNKASGGKTGQCAGL